MAYDSAVISNYQYFWPLTFLLTPVAFNFFLRYIRAVAYRWLIHWICGYMGWDNTRTLPACVYHNIRQKFQTVQTRGYQAAQRRLTSEKRGFNLMFPRQDAGSKELGYIDTNIYIINVINKKLMHTFLYGWAENAMV